MKIDAMQKLNDYMYIDAACITFRKNSVTIKNSYKIKDRKHMKMLLEFCDWQLERFTDFRINKFKYIAEWKAHNLLYFLHIARNHTKDVDFERKEKWYRQLGYWLLYPISFWAGV